MCPGSPGILWVFLCISFICLSSGNVTYTYQFEIHISIFKYVMNNAFLKWNLLILWMVVSLDKMIHTANNMNNFGINSYQGIVRYFKTTVKFKKNTDFISAALIAFVIHVVLPKYVVVKIWLIMLLVRVRNLVSQCCHILCVTSLLLQHVTMFVDHHHLEIHPLNKTSQLKHYNYKNKKYYYVKKYASWGWVWCLMEYSLHLTGRWIALQPWLGIT